MEQEQSLKYGRYKVVRTLGAGAMGIVYQAHDPQIDRTVALKVLRQDRQASEAYIRRFVKEAVAIGRLSHPRIVTVYDAGQENDAIYIAMEFLEGEALDTLMSKRRLGLAETTDIGLQVAEALDYAHSRGIVHRDVKPSNLLRRSDGLIKITDFGIAHIEDPTVTAQTQVGEILGTPAYMSPEQVQGTAVDGRSDLFSLGVILYELSTGERPFKGESVTSILCSIVDKAPRVPCEIQPELPPALSSIIMKCLNKKPEDRYQTGKELAEALKSCMAPPPPAPTPTPAPKPQAVTPAPRRSFKFIAIPAALVLTALLAYGAYQYTSMGPATPPEPAKGSIPAVTRDTRPPASPPASLPQPAGQTGQAASSSKVGGPAEIKDAPPSTPTTLPATTTQQTSTEATKPDPIKEKSEAPVLTLPAVDQGLDSLFQESMTKGIAAVGQKQFEEARQSFSQALSLKSDSEAYFQLLSTLIELRRDNQARDTYDKAVSLFPESPGLYEVYARYLASLGRVPEAMKIMDRAFALMPNDATVKEWRDYIASLNKPPATDQPGATATPGTTAPTAKVLPPYPISSQKTRKNPAVVESEKARALFTLAQQENKRLKWDDCLAGKAVQRAKDLVAAGFLDHKDPKTGTNPAWKLIASCRKVTNAGENLTQGYHPAETVHQELMKSDTHRKNILNSKFRNMGVGCSEYVCVEFFSGP